MPSLALFQGGCQRRRLKSQPLERRPDAKRRKIKAGQPGVGSLGGRRIWDSARVFSCGFLGPLTQENDQAHNMGGATAEWERGGGGGGILLKGLMGLWGMADVWQYAAQWAARLRTHHQACDPYNFLVAAGRSAIRLAVVGM